MQDILLRAMLGEGQVRVFLCSTRDLVEEARRIHGCSPVASAALGRTMSIGAIMGAMLKSPDDSLSITVNGGGPAGRIVVVSRPDGSVKGYLDHPETDLPIREDGKLDVGGAVGRDGRIIVVKDLGMKEPYMGQTVLHSGEIADDFALYFTRSEQQPSLVAAGVLVNPDESIRAAGALVVQPMPGCAEGILDDLELRSPIYADLSHQLDFYADAGTMLAELFGGMQPVVISSLTPRWRCDCNRERIERVLISLGADELTDMIRRDRGMEVQCHFCNTRHTFDERDLKKLLNEMNPAPYNG